MEMKKEGEVEINKERKRPTYARVYVRIYYNNISED